MNLETFSTADICDENPESLQILETPLTCYGGQSTCQGQIVTFSLDEDNRILKNQLQTQGTGKVAVIDVAGDICAVVGDKLAGFAIENGWNGIILNGFLRDSEKLRKMPIAIWAIGTYPQRSTKLNHGFHNVELNFAGVKFKPGAYLYADIDGILLLDSIT